MQYLSWNISEKKLPKRLDRIEKMLIFNKIKK